MTRIVLQPCKVRGTRFVPDKTRGPVEYDWPLLVSKLAPSGSPGARRVLASLRGGYYVGLLAMHGAFPTNFVMQNHDGPHAGDFTHLTRSNPTWKDRVLAVYRVEELHLGTSWVPLDEAKR